METFTPIAMKCTQEQFEAIKPKLNKTKSLNIFMFNKEWNSFYLSLFKDGSITNGLIGSSDGEVHEKWNEEIFLKACGIEVESLEQQLQKAEAEVDRLKKAIEEENIKLGDWVKRTHKGTEFFKADESHDYRYINSLKFFYQKITNPELIKLLEQEIK